MRPEFCASCIDGPAEVITKLRGIDRWICRGCYDGADHSLPDSIETLENMFFRRRIETRVRMNLDVPTRAICEYLGERVLDDKGNVDAEYQRVRRIHLKLLKRAA